MQQYNLTTEKELSQFHMIEVKHIKKEFVSPKKYPGLKGTIKSLFSREKITKTAVDDISFTIADGEIVGYIGSNGAGKSTTIKMMTGIMHPTAGQCLVNGIDPNKNRRQNAANIGVVFGQRTQLWWDLPLSESFTILKEIYDVSDKAYTERMAFINNVLDLEPFFDSPVRTLSLGQRMRADLGAALLHNPKVLYLDEPTIGLDIVVKDKIRDAIKELNQKYNTTVILTTHDIGDIEQLCSRIIVIDAGRKIYDGTLNHLKETYGTHCSISMEIRDGAAVSKLNLAEKLGVSEGDCTSFYDRERKTLEINFDKRTLSAPEILRAVMEIADVTDVQVRETELAEIVKQIYTHTLSASDASDNKGA